ncbi:MAG: UDP-3-O-(3-hydroxymyristoyl)glucosamine N-acyltransferase [Verrucomicrobiales bacterium]|nr:UDP-3-O-(3-hydroxymyristoyl)glucosamine N-acyltransferase [Verrucomicrobiales bacterium]
MSYTVAQIAEKVRGEVQGDGEVELVGLAPADVARPGDLTFAENETYLAAAEQSQATAILVPTTNPGSSKILIRVANPRVAFARVAALFSPPEPVSAGIHPSSTISPAAVVDPTAHVGPYCQVRAGARVGARSVLLGGNHIGRDVRIGDDVCLHENVVIYRGAEVGDRVIIHAGTVIGSDGYGYVFDEGRHQKVPQIGKVILQADVEIGANAAIDRGALGATIVGEGTKIDNLVHIAHNVVIGRHCLIMGQVGFAGSTRVGDYSVVASQSGISGHLNIGRQAVIGAKSGVMRDIPDGGRVLGIPASPDRQAKRQMIAVQQLPELLRRVRELESQVRALTAHPKVSVKSSHDRGD